MAMVRGAGIPRLKTAPFLPLQEKVMTAGEFEPGAQEDEAGQENNEGTSGGGGADAGGEGGGAEEGVTEK